MKFCLLSSGTRGGEGSWRGTRIILEFVAKIAVLHICVYVTTFIQKVRKEINAFCVLQEKCKESEIHRIKWVKYNAWNF